MSNSYVRSASLLGTLLGGATAVAVAIGVTYSAQAAMTSTWTVDTFTQFDAGDAASAMVTSLGEVRPGWDTSRVALEGDGVWAALRLSDGSVLLGSDVKGSILQLDRGAKTAKPVVSFADAIAVVALTQTADGAVYASTMPGNKVYKVDVKAGKATAVATLAGAETVWSLAAAADGTVYAGTGPDGKLYALRGGVAKEVYASGDKRVTSITVAPDGNVWFGTSERALVFRYDPKTSTGRAMADFAGNEIGAIAVARDGVVVAANELTEPTTGKSKSSTAIEAIDDPKKDKGTPIDEPKAGTVPGADKESSKKSDIERKGARKGKGAVFAIGNDGRVRQLHALTQTYVTSLAVAADGIIYAGAADKGRIYQIDPDDAVATALDVDERAVSQLWMEDGKLSFATDDAAAVYRTTGRAKAAKYVSDSFDAKAVAQFGRFSWQGDGKLTVETRSGNTVKPGAGWSPWQSPSKISASGGGFTGGKIASPVGRYLQFRVALTGDDSRFRRAQIYYVPQNLATEIKEVTVEPVSRDSQPTLKAAASTGRSAALRLKWTIDNPDSDSSSYLVDVRREGDAAYRSLVNSDDKLTALTWDWNTETFADGWYRVRITSTDLAANTVERALTSTKTSSLVVVDNTRPVIDALRVSYGKGAGKATVRATDALTEISELGYAIDDGKWQLGGTDDGLFDDQAESFTIVLPAGLPAGTHTVAIRVADSAGNVAAVSTAFVVK